MLSEARAHIWPRSNSPLNIQIAWSPSLFDLSWWFHETYSSWLLFLWENSDCSAFFSQMILIFWSAFEFFWVSVKNYYGVFPSWHHTSIIYLLWNSTAYIPLNLFSALLNFNWCARYTSFNEQANDRYFWIMLNHGWPCYMSKGIWTGDRSSAGSQNNKRKTAKYQLNDLQQAQHCYSHSYNFPFPRTITIYLFYIEQKNINRRDWENKQFNSGCFGLFGAKIPFFFFDIFTVSGFNMPSLFAPLLSLPFHIWASLFSWLFFDISRFHFTIL